MTVVRARKPVILVFVRHYLPGFKSGGPVRSLANLVERLGDALDFRIVTTARDMGDTAPYPGIVVDAWNPVGKAQVFYAGPASRSLVAMTRLIRRTPHDVLYVNSYFDPGFTLRPLLARRLGLVGRQPVIIAPRGELSDGALHLKRWKKQPFRWLAQVSGLYRNMTWHASTVHEAADIRAHIAPVPRVRISLVIASDLPRLPDGDAAARRRTDAPLRVLFLSRISPMKNLQFALRVLARVQAPVSLSIFGPLEDKDYWSRCEELIRALPPHVTATYQGIALPSQIPEIMADHELLLLPTLGENFGHVIAEALSVGTPVLISDTTPWRNLEQAGVGWDLPLSSEEAFAARIDACAAMADDDYQALRQRVRAYANKRLTDPALIESNLRLFLDLVPTS